MKLQSQKMVKFDVHISPIFSCWVTYCFNGKLKSCNVFVITLFRQTSVRFSRYSVSSEDSWVTTFALLHNHYGVYCYTIKMRMMWKVLQLYFHHNPSINTKTVTCFTILCSLYILPSQEAKCCPGSFSINSNWGIVVYVSKLIVSCIMFGSVRTSILYG